MQNLTRGLRWDPSLVRTISVVRKGRHQGSRLEMVVHCAHSQTGPGLGYGRWTGTHSTRQAEPGHRTAVAMGVGQAGDGGGGSGRG